MAAGEILVLDWIELEDECLLCKLNYIPTYRDHQVKDCQNPFFQLTPVVPCFMCGLVDQECMISYDKEIQRFIYICNRMSRMSG